MFKSFQSIGRVAIVLLAAVFIAGCATPSAQPEEIIAKRAKARWDALIARRWEDAYSYLSPSYRAVVTQARYSAQFGGPVIWLGAEVLDVACKDEGNCTARINISFRPVLSKQANRPLETAYDETWIREEGAWWFFEKL